MKFGLSLPPFGDFADPHYLADIARQAEAAGWDGFFIWDHMMFDPSFHAIPDMWLALAAVAMKTSSLKIGTMVTPIARRRPWKLARETVTLDQLSNGRLILGAGLGEPPQWDFGFFGEETDAKIRAKKLDEGLDILNGLWGGEMFGYEGEQYKLTPVRFQPRPVQSPRIPIWIGGNWDKHAPMRRAARWDGYFPLKWGGVLAPDEWKVIMAYIKQHRTSDASFDWVHGGATPGENLTKAAEQVRPYAEIGITWWVESIDPWRWGASWEDQWKPDWTQQMNERILQGPPKL